MGSSLERQRVDHRKLDKKVRSQSETFQQLPPLSSQRLPQMSTSRNTPGATVFGPGIRGNPPRAVYERLSRNTGGKNACIQGLHGDYIVIF